MSGRFRAQFAAVAVLAAMPLIAGAALAQNNGGNNTSPPLQPIQPPKHGLGDTANAGNAINQATASSANMMIVPHVHIIPGNVKPPPGLKNPMADDPNSAERGRKYFINFNCVGCHAPYGGGGMGIALSDSTWKFGSSAAAIYLVISHGAPLGMPAWGSVLPDNVIWDMVSYVQGLAKHSKMWGSTISMNSPAIEQKPAEFMSTTKPWQHTERFSNGQKPTGHQPTHSLGMASPTNHPMH